MKKRLVIEIESKEEILTLNKFKSKCYMSGDSMKTILIQLIKKYLGE